MIRIYYILVYTGCWFGTWLGFFHILGILIPTDELIFFRGVESTNQYIYIYLYMLMPIVVIGTGVL